MNPEFFKIEVGGKTLTVFYPQFETNEGFKVVSEENHLPVVLKDHEDYLDILEYIATQDEYTVEKLGELADLIEQMSLLAKGPKGDSFVYEDFTQEQLADLKGDKGDAFKYEDFTQEQLEGLRGPQGPVNTQAQTDIDDHKDNKNNPHNVTKSQVGLSVVNNYGIASKNEAEEGTANNKYMTPIRTKQAIDANSYVLETQAGEDYVFKKFVDGTWELYWIINRIVDIKTSIGADYRTGNIADPYPINLGEEFVTITQHANPINLNGANGANIHAVCTAVSTGFDGNNVRYRLLKPTPNTSVNVQMSFLVKGVWS